MGGRRPPISAYPRSADDGSNMRAAGIRLIRMSLRPTVNPLGYRALGLGMAAWAIGAAIFFREPLLASFHVIFGDTVDGSLIIYTHEHLFRAITGHAQFLSPPFFYPQPNVLGFTDAVLLDLLPYAIFRGLGVDMFLSAQLMFLLMSLLSFVAVLIICTRYLAVRTPIALCAAALITFPTNL